MLIPLRHSFFLRQLIGIDSVNELVVFLETQYGAICKKLDNMVAEGQISYKGTKGQLRVDFVNRFSSLP